MPLTRMKGRYAGLVWLVIAFFLFVFSVVPSHALVSEQTKAEASDLVQLITASPELDAYLQTRRHINELKNSPDIKRRGDIYKELIFHALDMGDVGMLQEYSERALRLAYETENTELQIYGELAQASVLGLSGAISEATDAVNKARALAVRDDDAVMVFFADAVMSFLGPELGNNLEGLSKMAQGAAGLPDTPRGNQMRMLAFLMLGYTYSGIRETDEIIRYYRMAVEFGRLKTIPFDRESALFNIAISLSENGAHEHARQYFIALQDMLLQTGHTKGNYYALHGLARVEFAMGDYEQSIAHATDALNNYPDDPYFNAMLDNILAVSHARNGNIEAARHHMDQSKRFYAENPELTSKMPSAQHKLTLAYILRAEGKTDEAFELLDKAREDAKYTSYKQFKASVSDLRTNLQALIEKQQTEIRLEETEDAYTRMTVIFSVLIALCAATVLILQYRHTRALQKSMIAAEMANRTKSDFLANMSHELRTPLNAILGFSEMMIEGIFGKLGNKKYRDYAEHIHASGTHLLDIINDILDLSKIESGRLVLQETDVDLRQMFEDTKALMIPRAREHVVDLTVHVDDNVPHLRADWRLLKQILLNLLSNGVKFTEACGRVSMMAHYTGEGAIQIEVIDSGMGMNPDELEEALTPFGQAGTTMTRSHEGTGLGLPLVKSLVELHGGELFIRSRRHIGTTVQILMPPERSVPIHALSPSEHTVI